RLANQQAFHLPGVTPMTRAFGLAPSRTMGSRVSQRPTLPALSTAWTRTCTQPPISGGTLHWAVPLDLSPRASCCHGPSADGAQKTPTGVAARFWSLADQEIVNTREYSPLPG